MREFESDRKKEKQLYRRIRKKYKRWIYGNSGMAVCIVLIFVIFWWISNQTGRVTPEVFVVSVGVSFVPLLIGGVCRALAVSGGREVLMNRLSDKVVLTEDFVTMEYTPHARETTEFGYICYRIRYGDIEALEYQKGRGRLKISGSYRIIRYRQAALGEIPGNMIIEDVRNGFFYLYAHYHEFETCIKQIADRAGRKISYKED